MRKNGLCVALLSAALLVTGCGKKTPPKKSEVIEPKEYVINQDLGSNDDFTFKLTKIEVGDDIDLTYHVENKTDKKLNFVADEIYVNGFYVSGIDAFYSIESGDERDCSLSFSLDYDTTNDIDLLEFNARVSEVGTYKELFSQDYTLYPSGLSKDEIKLPDRPKFNNEKVVVDNEFANVVFYDGQFINGGDYNIDVYYENRIKDGTYYFAYENVKVNGSISINNGFYGTSVRAERRTFSYVLITKSELEENNITSLKSISFTLKMYKDGVVGESPITIDYTYTLE